MVDDLAKTATAIRIGRDTIGIAVQSIWIGIALSVGLMAVAAVGLVPAGAGALSQELVDLATILNVLRSLKLKERGTAAGMVARHRPAPMPAPDPR